MVKQWIIVRWQREGEWQRQKSPARINSNWGQLFLQYMVNVSLPIGPQMLFSLSEFPCSVLLTTVSLGHKHTFFHFYPSDPFNTFTPKSPILTLTITPVCLMETLNSKQTLKEPPEGESTVQNYLSLQKCPPSVQHQEWFSQKQQYRNTRISFLWVLSAIV